MTTTLTLEFSDRIDLHDLLGVAFTIPRADREMAVKIGLDVALLEERLRAQRILVSDALARLILAQISTALRLEDDCHVYISDRHDEPYMASITSDD